MSALRAPFPWFGGKSRVSAEVWSAFGDVAHYIEPFAGSLAVLLGRPTEPRVETVNDLDCYVSNFWRATAANAEDVARHADWPVNEADLSARHQWLVDQAGFRERMKTDPDYHDARIAGWWVWGLCQWIGSGWCDSAKYLDGNPGRGVNRQLPHMSNPGQGVNRKLSAGAFGEGVAAASVEEWMGLLQQRLRRVRVACGDWSRVVSPAVIRGALAWPCGILLDPPYDEGAMAYAVGGGVVDAVREWAIANGDDPKLRIALCGYEGQHAMPSTWRCHAWKANGGYAGQNTDGNANARRERIWFSPHCQRPAQRELFAVGG